MNKLRIGIIGAGNISNYHMKGYLKAADRCEVVAAADIDAPRLAAYCGRYGLRGYSTAGEMLEKEQLDAVSVCTWNSAHAEATIAALDAGVNVLCEKPMATCTADAQRMADSAAKSGKLLQLGFVRRFGNDADSVRDFVNAGTFGDIYYAKATYLRRDGCPGGWFCDKSRSGGGPLIDLGVHIIDLVRYLAGNPAPVSAYGVTYNNLGLWRAAGGSKVWSASKKRPEIYDVEDFCSATVRFDSGLTLSIETSFALNTDEDSSRIDLFGTKAGASLKPELAIYTDVAGRYVNMTPTGKTALDFNGLFEREIEGFLDAVEGKEPCRAKAEDGVVVMQIIDAIYESARTGKLVYIK